MKNKLRRLFNKGRKVGDIKNCKVKEVSNEKRKKFLEENHLKGEVDNSSSGFGLFFQERMVGLLTFCRSGDKLRILRTCFSEFVEDGLHKIIKKMVERESFERIIACVDRRYGNRDNVYESFGFDFVEKIDSLCWYFENGSDEIKSCANIEEDGYNRIWDCGYLKYEFSVQ